MRGLAPRSPRRCPEVTCLMGFSTFATISRLRGRMATDAACGGGVCPERWALPSGAERRDSGGRSGSCYASPLLRKADVVLSVFENSGAGFARLQRLSPRAGSVPHVMLTCWLAQDCQEMSPHQLRSVQRSIPGVSKMAVFSKNQVPILQAYFGLEPERISVVPFGVDTDHYTAPVDSGPAGGGGLVAIGSDSRRDYATLFEAVRIANVPLVFACSAPEHQGFFAVPAPSDLSTWSLRRGVPTPSSQRRPCRDS